MELLDNPDTYPTTTLQSPEWPNRSEKFRWTTTRSAQLRELWAAGLIASQIADELGASRRTVTRKARALGLPGGMKNYLAAIGARDWTPEQDKQLQQDWNAEGLSATEIGDKWGLSRSAVLGRINRLRKAGVFFESRQSTPRPRAPRAERGRRKFQLPSTAFAKDRRQFMRLNTYPQEFLCLNIVELESHHCRWPEGDQQITFCGNIRYDGSYCRYHGLMGRKAK